MANTINVPRVPVSKPQQDHQSADTGVGMGKHAAHVSVQEPWDAQQQKQTSPERPFDSFRRNSSYPGVSSTARASRHVPYQKSQQQMPQIQGNPSAPRGYVQPQPHAFDDLHQGNVVAKNRPKKESEKSVFSDLSMAQVIAGALAAVTSLLLSNVIGLAGSVIGVAVASIVSTVSSQAYKHFLAASAENIKSHVSNSDDSNEEWAENIENGTAARPIPGAAAAEAGTATQPASEMKAARPTTTPHLGDKGAMTETGIHKRASKIKKTKVQRGVIIISIISALLAVVVYAVFINVATQGQGVGTKTPSIISASDTTSNTQSSNAQKNTGETQNNQEGPNKKGPDAQNSNAEDTSGQNQSTNAQQNSGNSTTSSDTSSSDTTSNDSSSTGSTGTSQGSQGTSDTSSSGNSGSQSNSGSQGTTTESGSGSSSNSSSSGSSSQSSQGSQSSTGTSQGTTQTQSSTTQAQ